MTSLKGEKKEEKKEKKIVRTQKKKSIANIFVK